MQLNLTTIINDNDNNTFNNNDDNNKNCLKNERECIIRFKNSRWPDNTQLGVFLNGFNKISNTD